MRFQVVEHADDPSLRDGLRRSIFRVKALIRVLESRGFAVDADVHRRVESCADVPVLEQWIDRDVTASDLEAVFAGAT